MREDRILVRGGSGIHALTGHTLPKSAEREYTGRASSVPERGSAEQMAMNSAASGNTAPEDAFADKRETLLRYRAFRSATGSFRPAGKRIRAVCDPGTFEEFAADLESSDPLQFPEYREKLAQCRMRTGALDAAAVGTARIAGIPVVIGELDPDFCMGSMGTVVGEKVARACEMAGERHCPLILFSASGGARMQEGMYSLMQMAKTAAAVRRFQKNGGLYVSVLTNPVTGGVSASFAFLGDIILAEPGALIGFAGPRVIEKTIGQRLPAHFQSAEFQREHGFVDIVVLPEKMRETLIQILQLHTDSSVPGDHRTDRQTDPSVPQFESAGQTSGRPASDRTEEAAAEDGAGIKKTAWERVQEARSADRPRLTDYISCIFTGFCELAGDRLGGEDPAILGGIARLDGIPVTVIGHRKGHDLKENIACRFGMASPEGYRKALRLMKQAARFHRPVITFIDTPGAYPGKEAEENGQSAAIAENLAAMSDLPVPVIALVTGEGASGGALGIGAADRILMLENSVYYVLSPEGFAAILWKDEKRAGEAAGLMRVTASELAAAGLADRVIPEPDPLNFRTLPAFGEKLRDILCEELAALSALTPEELTERRYRRYRSFDRDLMRHHREGDV